MSKKRIFTPALNFPPNRRESPQDAIAHTDGALYPIIRQMERAAWFTHDDTAQAKLDKLDALLAKSSRALQEAALLADMVSLPNDGRYSTLDRPTIQRSIDPPAAAVVVGGACRPTGGSGVSQVGVDDFSNTGRCSGSGCGLTLRSRGKPDMPG